MNVPGQILAWRLTLLTVLVGALISFSTNVFGQNLIRKWTSTDGWTRAIEFWLPKELRERRNQWTNYEVARTEDGDLQVSFVVGDSGRNARGIFGVYSISQDKIIQFSELVGDDNRFTQKVLDGIEQFSEHDRLQKASQYSDLVIDPLTNKFVNTPREFLIDFFHKKRALSCDTFATAFYPSEKFKQRKYGRVLIRINKLPRIRTSDKFCEEWLEQQIQLLFVEAIAPDIYRLGHEEVVFVDPNYPILIFNKGGNEGNDSKFCIDTPNFRYIKIEVDELDELLLKVKSKQQYFENLYPSYNYASTVQENIYVMQELISLKGGC